MKNVVIIKDRKTGEIKHAIYSPNRLGHLRYHVEVKGEFKAIPDKQFDKQYQICTE